MKTLRLFLSKFFPITLFLLVLRRNLVVLSLWLALFALVSGQWMGRYGMPFLFLSPEYRGEVSLLSFFILGLCAGLFVMAFHVSTYVFHSLRFPFLATLNRPLYRFAINNSVLPLSFYGFYAYNIYQFGLQAQQSALFRWAQIGALFLGSVLVIGLVFSYFFSTLRPIAPPVTQQKRKGLGLLAGRMTLKDIDELQEEAVYAYLRTPLSIRIPRNTGHYSKELLIKTIHRHHLSAVAFAILLLFGLGLMGYYGDQPWLEIPAGGTFFLILSLGLMAYTIFYTWFKAWTPAALVVGIVLLDQSARFSQVHPAFGMVYQKDQKVLYTDSAFESLVHLTNMEADRNHWEELLSHWKRQTGELKPWLILLNVSGGGLRSSVFTYEMWRELDAVTNGSFSQHCVLVTGASGGMLGAAYYRAQYGNRWEEDPERQARVEAGRSRMGLDLLNPTAFHLVVNDLLIRLKRAKAGGQVYAYDRGYAFDQKLLENSGGVLSGSVAKRKQAEWQADYPALILAPTVVNDGRRLLIGTQPMSFLCSAVNHRDPKSAEIDGLELSRLFAPAAADSLRFVTALRMSASFPYITPLVEMPSQPSIELIDAGVRDNDGFELALRWLENMAPWIEQNCGGVMMVRLRGDRPEKVEISNTQASWTGRWLRPVDGVVRSFSNLQTYTKVDLREKTDWMPFSPVFRDYYLFQQDEQFALSWHLTKAEKDKINLAVAQLEKDSAEIAFWKSFGRKP